MSAAGTAGQRRAAGRADPGDLRELLILSPYPRLHGPERAGPARRRRGRRGRPDSRQPRAGSRSRSRPDRSRRSGLGGPVVQRGRRRRGGVARGRGPGAACRDRVGRPQRRSDSGHLGRRHHRPLPAGRHPTGRSLCASARRARQRRGSGHHRPGGHPLPRGPQRTRLERAGSAVADAGGEGSVAPRGRPGPCMPPWDCCRGAPEPPRPSSSAWPSCIPSRGPPSPSG